MIEYIKERFNNDNKKCEGILEDIYINLYPKMTLQDKKAFILHLQDYYKSIHSYEKLMKYIEIEKSLKNL